MAATPQYGALKFVAPNGTTRQVDIYVSDVANALIRLDSGAGASSASDTFWTAPCDCVLTDFLIHTGTADTTNLSLTRNNVQTGNTMRYAAHLDTSQGRPSIAIAFKAGDKIGAIQRA